MGKIRVSTSIGRPPDEVWDDLRDIASHAEWMADAEEIRFTSTARTGVGTSFECVTRVGPIRLTDVMEVTEWQEGRVMGVRHIGVVTGTGRFTLGPDDHGGTRFTWEERLRFPWWMGGPLGGVVGDRVMRAIWRRNLRTLRGRLEG
ncbi:MAG TPA: SRPBCC family protein [Acidimicrobiales bacterium]|nr:SRPBCC family protein [Acidimicrobiales bacterium]